MHQLPMAVRLDPDTPYRPHPGKAARPLNDTEATEIELLTTYSAAQRAAGHDVERYRADYPDGTVTSIDLLDTTAQTLVTARATLLPMVLVHYTIGELLDVQRLFDPLPDLVLLTSAQPSENTTGLLHSIGITVVWPDPLDPSGFATAAPPEPTITG